MPDDDRFECLLRGRGWRSAYRLAAGNSEINLLVDSFIKAAAHALRNQTQSPSLSEMANVPCESLNVPSLHDGRTPSGLEVSSTYPMVWTTWGSKIEVTSELNSR